MSKSQQRWFDPGVGGEHALHVGVDLADLGSGRGRHGHGGRIGTAAAERGDVVVRGQALEAGDDDDVALSQRSQDSRGSDSTIRAAPCCVSVMMPACDPVYEAALQPRALIAIASNDIAIRSPAVSSMSSSRGSGPCDLLAIASRSSVVSPMAETATMTWYPSSLARTTDRRRPGSVRSSRPTFRRISAR